MVTGSVLGHREALNACSTTAGGVEEGRYVELTVADALSVHGSVSDGEELDHDLVSLDSGV